MEQADMFMNYRIAVALGFALLGLAPWNASAADDLRELTEQRCVTITSISKTEIIDAQTILFYMRGSEIYENRLPRRCPGLRSRSTFMYKTSLPQLCELDFITVLYNQGFGFSEGASCSLGPFLPITEDQVLALKAGDRDEEEVPERKEVPSAEPEEIDEPE